MLILKRIKDFKEEIIICSIFLFFAFGFNIYRVQSDGKLYYSFLETILQIHNRESEFIAGFQQAGCAYFNAPFYLVAYWIESLLHKSFNFGGITLRQISINIASNFYMVLSLLIMVKLLRKLNFRHIMLPILSVLFSTSAFCVAVTLPSFTHATDIFINTVFIYLLLAGDSKDKSRFFWLGVTYVISVLVRYTNFILIVLPIIYCLISGQRNKIKYFFSGLLSIGWIIPLIFYIYNGSALSVFLNTHDTVKIISEMPLYPKYALKLLLHPLHGLFIWSPVTILSVVGLLVFPKPKERVGYLLLGVCVLLVLLLGFTYSWNAGWSFSNRYLVGFFPIYIIGLAAFIDKYSRGAIYAVILLLFYSIILYLNWMLCIINGEFGTVGNMFTAWIKGQSDTFIDKKVNLPVVLNRLYEYCRYKYFFKILR